MEIYLRILKCALLFGETADYQQDVGIQEYIHKKVVNLEHLDRAEEVLYLLIACGHSFQ